MGRKKLKKYNVIWEEKHSVRVEAKNRQEAEDKAESGLYASDESVKITRGFEAFEVK